MKKAINPGHVRIVKKCIKNYLETLAEQTNSSDSPRTNRTFFQYGRRSSATTLDLSNLYLTDAEFVELLPDLKKVTVISEIELDNNNITGHTVKHLCKLFPNIERLSLEDTKIKYNDGCAYLAKFKKLVYVAVSSNELRSKDFDQLLQSNSLLRVCYVDNDEVDIIRKAKLRAAIDYNNKVHVQKGVGVKTMDISKESYIRKNLEKFRKEAQEHDKGSAELRAMLHQTYGNRCPDLPMDGCFNK